MNETETSLREFVAPSDELDVVEWGRQHYTLDKSSTVIGTFDIDYVPWMAQPLADWKNSAVTDIFLMMGLQLVKTTAGGLCLAYSVVEDPGPALWYHSDAQLLQAFVEQRLFDSWERSEIIARLLPPRQELSWKSVNFDTMAVNFITIGSKAARTGNPARYVFGDEIKDWPPGAWPTVKKRTARWVGLCKRFGFSTPNQVGDDCDLAFKEGNQCHYFFHCPYCAEPQEFDFIKSVEWDRHLLDDGRYDLNRICESIRMQCVHCKAVLAESKDIARERQQRMALLRTARWVPRNPHARPDSTSYTCQSLASPIVPLSELVAEYLNAKTAEKLGVIQPLQDFYNQRLARSWGDIEEAEGLENTEAFAPGTWVEEKTRFITVDCQYLDVLYAQAWQWSASGKARLLGRRKVDGFPGVREFQTELAVKDDRVFLDSRFNRSAVFAECARWKWVAMMGEDKDSYPWYVRKIPNGPVTVVHRIVSPAVKADPAQGTRRQGRMGVIEVRKFSNLHCKDILAKMIQTKQYVVPDNVDADYALQMKSERKVKQPNGKWKWVRIGQRANHYWDCATMQVAVGIIAGLVKMDFQKAG